jgi:cold shock CspA family protein
MRTHGTLSKWNEERGFGFIVPAEGHGEIFVHISAFPRDGVRPRVGEVISYEIETGDGEKKRAVRVLRPGSRSAMHRARRTGSSKPKRNLLPAILSLLAAVAIGAYAYTTITSGSSYGQARSSAPITPSAPNQAFRCDGRTHCSQMTSCAEATYFLQHCPNTQMDGNGDGEPCEQQWCN